MGSFYIENFGCRATQADGAALESQFLERGLTRVHAPREAEIVVLNTCTVTESAEKDARATIRRVRRENPECRILVTGCYAQRAPDELAALPGVSWVVGNSHKHLAADIATSRKSSMGFVPLAQLNGDSAAGYKFHTAADVIVGDIFAHTELLAAPVFDSANERTRPNLKVQDGCDNRCSFCVIPSVRGKSRSLPLERVINEVRSLVSAGYREVVISGINLGRWGRDLAATSPSSLMVGSGDSKRMIIPGRRTTNDPGLEHLVRSILEHTSVEKLRISSVEPMDWSEELIGMMATSPRIAKHAHVPLQSGSDAVLRRMHRKYRPWHYREKILKIRAAMSDAAIGADVMVGFPGETEAEFAETRRMVEELPFTYLHVFTYSARPGTPAAGQADQVPAAVARERNSILREIAASKKTAFLHAQVSSTVEAITLAANDDNFTPALTHNYLKMQIAGRWAANQWINARVEDTTEECLQGFVPQLAP